MARGSLLGIPVRGAVGLAAAVALLAGTASGQSIDAATCSFAGIPLSGQVGIVEHGGDIAIEAVTAFPDIDVKLVESFPDDCGEWSIVESFPDFTVTFVTSFPDLKVRFVESFPGIP